MGTVATSHYDRFSGARRHGGADPRSPVAVDRDRLVHCHAFRRLQRKTQIVGLPGDDFLRTRLTHTIECAQVGRAIAARIGKDDLESVVDDPRDIVDLVEAACLVHDLGHPPFGHTGEEALDEVLAERVGWRFEGNAQSFRIVTLLEPKKYNRELLPIPRPLGLDLTRTTLRASCKYPWTDRDPRAEEPGRKFGIYSADDDLEYFAWLWDGDPSAAARTLATEVLEAADDIAYAVHDIEDGIWAQLIPVDQIVQLEDWACRRIARVALERSPDLFRDVDDVVSLVDEVFGVLRERRWASGPFDRSRDSEGGLKSFCSALTGQFIGRVTADGVLRWRSDRELRRTIAMLKAIVWVWMIDQPSLVTQRYGHRRIIAELVDGFLREPAMLPYPSEWERISERSDAERTRLVADHVASMTDNEALRIFTHLTGRAWMAPLTH